MQPLAQCSTTNQRRLKVRRTFALLSLYNLTLLARVFISGHGSKNVTDCGKTLPHTLLCSDKRCKVKPMANFCVASRSLCSNSICISLEWFALMNLLSVGYDDSAALLPWVISARDKAASTSTLWSQRQRELLMRKHKLTRNGMGMTFESEAFFNQPCGN